MEQEANMIDLLEKVIDLWARTNWIKVIRKEERALERAKDDVKRHEYVLNHLRNEFLKLYPAEVQDGN